MAWNVIPDPKSDRLYTLAGVGAVVRLAESVEVDIAAVLDELESRDVPISYAAGLKEIYFTVLPSDTRGHVVYADYSEGVIRVSCGSESRGSLAKNIVHELGHHLENEECFTHRPKIVDECRRLARKGILREYAAKDPEEYAAVGLEIFYFGSRFERGELRRKYPRLYNMLRYLHRKHSRR